MGYLPRLRWGDGVGVNSKRKRRTGSQALIERIPFEEAGCAVAGPNHSLRIDLIGKAQSRHDLLVIRLIASTGGANNRTCHSARGNVACVLHRAAGKNVRRLIVLLIPGLIVLVANSEVQGKPRGCFEVILEITSNTPLPIAQVPERVGELHVRDAAKNEIGRRIAWPIRCVGIPGVGSAVSEGSKETYVPGLQVILLIAGSLTSNGPKVASSLPRQTVLVIERVVSEYLQAGRVTEGTDIRAHTLVSKSCVSLRIGKWYAHLLLAI